MTEIRIGTRGSRLALVQTGMVADALRACLPDARIETVIIKTKGDRILDKPLGEIGDKGLFVSELEAALLEKKVDIAVHSATAAATAYRPTKPGSVHLPESRCSMRMRNILIFPDKLLAMFNASENMLAIGIPALRIISISFMFAGFCIVMGSVFQALGNGVYSLVVSVARQLIVLLPAAYLLSLTGNVNNVWWAFPIAELMSLSMTLFFYGRINRKIISKIGEPVLMPEE